MPRASFRTQLFVAAFSASLLALIVAAALFALSMRSETNARIERTLVAEARLASELIGRQAPVAADPSGGEFGPIDEEADRLGALLNSRVTLIAPDGRVVGDSAEPVEALITLENHLTRPEVVGARASGVGTSRRYSDTLNIDMFYAAAPVTHPSIGFVRVALPLTDVRQQFQTVLVATLVTFGIAGAGAAGLSVLLARRLGQRVKAIANVAKRYGEGDLTPPRHDYGDDELGAVARTLDASVHELGRRLAELARDRGRMAAILASMIEGVIVVDPQGRLELVNDAAEDMLKLDTAPLGRHYVETIRHPAITDLVTATLAGHEQGAVELAPPRDPARTVIARAAPTVGGGAHGVVLVLHDITELRRADQIRRDFVANVSHELRTPLTAIRGYVEALADGDADAQESRRFLEIVKRHALRMEVLVKDLLRLARLDARQELLEIAACDVRGLIQGVASDLTPALEARGQRLEVTIEAGAESVHGDPSKLHDVLRNLVANACTYGPEHSTIRVVARRENDSLAIDVLDEGPGIPEEDLSRVFERFYRVDKSRARDPGGTGLGLAIVRHLVELHGGKVAASNRPEGGAKFTITLDV